MILRNPRQSIYVNGSAAEVWHAVTPIGLSFLHHLEPHGFPPSPFGWDVERRGEFTKKRVSITVTNLFLNHEEREPTNGRQAAYQAAESKVIDNSMKKKE